MYDIDFFSVVLRLHGDLEHGQGSHVFLRSSAEGLLPSGGPAWDSA